MINATVYHTNDPTPRRIVAPIDIVNQLDLAQRSGAAGISVHSQEPFISGCITSRHEAYQLVAKFAK